MKVTNEDRLLMANADIADEEARSGGKSGTLSTSSLGGGYGKKRKAEQSRKQMNLTSGRTKSILTS